MTPVCAAGDDEGRARGPALLTPQVTRWLLGRAVDHDVAASEKRLGGNADLLVQQTVLVVDRQLVLVAADARALPAVDGRGVERRVAVAEQLIPIARAIDLDRRLPLQRRLRR